MNYEDLLIEVKNGIATITLNVPERKNTLSEGIREGLRAAAGEIAGNDDIRVVVVTGAGDAFCAGGDLKALKDRLAGKTDASRYERLRQLGYWSSTFLHLDKPVIAAINGPAVGAGLSLAMSCDIRIASERAKFGSLFVSRGLVPDCSLTYHLPRAVGVSKALELMFTGELFDAAEAKVLGIVSRVVPHDQLMPAAYELARKIAVQPPIAVELTKRLVYGEIKNDVARQISSESAAQLMCLGSEDFRERALAFLEKRPVPPPKGR